MTETKAEKENMTLEEAFEALDQTIAKMQGSSVSLEESFASYEEGMKLLKLCTQKIDLIEKKVTELSGEGENGEFF